MSNHRRGPQSLRFTKMHGLGNDFVVLDLVSQYFNLRTRHIQKIADRKLGVGCDQVLAVEVPGSPDADFRYRIFNADGSEVEQCGNGARCFARFVRDKRLTRKRHLVVDTLGGRIELLIRSRQQVEVNMGAPVLTPADIPFSADTQQDNYTLELQDTAIEIGAVSMGNPHAIVRVDNATEYPVADQGPQIENHSCFPNRVNAGFMQVVNRKRIDLRVHERGVGETQACGTGACAAVVYGIKRNWLDNKVDVHLRGGKLSIHWAGPGHPVMMTGPTAVVFEGTIKL